MHIGRMRDISVKGNVKVGHAITTSDLRCRYNAIEPFLRKARSPAIKTPRQIITTTCLLLAIAEIAAEEGNAAQLQARASNQRSLVERTEIRARKLPQIQKRHQPGVHSTPAKASRRTAAHGLFMLSCLCECKPLDLQ